MATSIYTANSTTLTDTTPGRRAAAIGRSKGGLTTKILALTDALGNLVRFVLLPGHRYDTVGVAPLIENLEFEGLIGDKAFDANWIIEELNERGAKSSSLSAPTAERRWRSTRRSTNGATSSKTSLAS